MNITTWLDSPDKTYQDALTYYRMVRQSKSKDNFFASFTNPPQDSLAFSMIIQEIKKGVRILSSQNKLHLVTSPQKAKSQIRPASTKTRITANPFVDISKLPKDKQRLFERNQQITKTLSGLSQKIKLVKTDNERQLIAAQIDKLFKERKSNWAAIDADTKPKEQPQEQKADPKDVLKKQRRIKTIKSNLTRAKKELKSGKLSEKKASQRKTRIEQWTKELSELEQFMASL